MPGRLPLIECVAKDNGALNLNQSLASPWMSGLSDLDLLVEFFL